MKRLGYLAAALILAVGLFKAGEHRGSREASGPRDMLEVRLWDDAATGQRKVVAILWDRRGEESWESVRSLDDPISTLWDR